MPNSQSQQSTLILENQLNIQADKKKLRQIIRQRRRSLSPTQQRLASKNLIKQIKQSKLLLKHQHIALYLGNDGELNPEILIKLLWKYKKYAYLPVIHPLYQTRLCFCLVRPNTHFIKNKYGIFEPDYKYTRSIHKMHLSLVLMPLVAFDNSGNRMGMGGGFYDRSFAYKARKNLSKPKLIGLAHAFQEQVCLPIEKWDIPLDGVLTDQKFYQFKQKSSI